MAMDAGDEREAQREAAAVREEDDRRRLVSGEHRRGEGTRRERGES